MNNIVVIDDNDHIRRIIRLYLEKFGYNVSEATDGESGVKIFGDLPADLVIVDMFMPNKNGVKTVQEIIDIKPDTKFIAISGGGFDDGDQYVQNIKELGVSSLLSKPFEPCDLVEEVRRLMGSVVGN